MSAATGWPRTHRAPSSGTSPKASSRARPAAASPTRPAPDARYYQALHESNARYQTINWLLEELPVLRAAGASSILDVGCGNGLFLAQAAVHWAEVTGIDWARSPTMEGVLREHPGVRFIQQDVADFRPDRRYGVVASADFLEHLPPAALPDVLRRLDAAGDGGYHKIACYDDGHSHLSVFSPRQWLERFRQACPDGGYRMVKTALRARGREVVVISNLPGDAVGADAEPAAVEPGMRLDVGCGPRLRPGHVGVDVRALPGVGIVCDAWELDERLPPHSVESIYCRHFFEHLTFAQGRRTLQAFHRVLRPGGELQVIVPDMRYHMRQYLDARPSTRSDANAKWSARQHALASLFGWQRDGERELWDVHKAGYDQATLTEALAAAGFGRVRRLPEQPWHLSVTAIAE